MPFYEFYSPKTNTVYTFFARTLGFSDKTPRCPDDPKAPMQKQVSQFSFVRQLNVESDPALDDDKYDDPRYEKAINELEREFQGMDDNNPDPRQLGRLMRRMGELTGQQLPGSMEEMARRLESGEDPEALEEEFGDDFEDDFDPMAAADGNSGNKLLRRLRSTPRKDPEIYEMADFVD